MSADEELLYGVLALLMGFVNRDALGAAMAAWSASRSRPLSALLIERGAIRPDDHPLVAEAVRRQLARHGDPSHCISALDVDLGISVMGLVQTVGDAAVPPPQGTGFLDTRVGYDPSPLPSPLPGLGPDPSKTTLWAGPPPHSITEPDPAAATAPPDGDESKLPRFRALRPHARGGLGEVFVAWDRELGRHVALKEIRPEFADNTRARSRFVREAEVNGNLEHPGIVPVYGLGIGEGGRPYYAMRFVQGETLQDAIERLRKENRGTRVATWIAQIRPLLRRFLVVCEAIEYAHSRGVLHRDLKPANILLGKFGETLIIDWGLAKVVRRAAADAPGSAHADSVGSNGPAVREGEGEGAGDVQPRANNVFPALEELINSADFSPSESGAVPTVAGETLGSPPYMSPEQARGKHDSLTPATDIYSLGATLSALLTGRPPVIGAGTPEILAKVGSGEIDRPRALNPRVPKPLEAICLKAMQLEPSDRYPSARAFSDDLERWLADQPVSVFADPITTRLFRWARQHKVWVASSLALLVTALVGLAAATAVVSDQKSRAERARDEANAARALARDHLKVGLDVVDQLVTYGDRQLISQQSVDSRKKFLDSAVFFIQKFRQREPDDTVVQTQTGQIARRLANLYALTGRFEQSDPLHDEAVATLEGVASKSSPDASAVDLLAEALLDRGDAHVTRGKLASAERDFQRATDLTRALISAQGPTGPQRAQQRTLGRALSRLAEARLALNVAGVERLADEAVLALQKLADASLTRVRSRVLSGSTLELIDQLELVHALDTRAQVDALAGRPPDARLREALERTRELADHFRGLPINDLTFISARTATRLARALPEGTGDTEAVTLLDGAVKSLTDLNQRAGDILHFRTALADARTAHARVLARMPSDSPAVSAARAARTQLNALTRECPNVPELHHLLADSLITLARLALRRDPPAVENARELLNDAISAEETALEPNSENPFYKKRLAEALELKQALDSK
jgi:serine/threonine-protein kinase